MVYVCAIAECKNNKIVKNLRGVNLLFHTFPKTSDVRNSWIAKCKRGDKFNPNFAAVCSDHFKEDDYHRDLKNELLGLPIKRKLKSTAVPTVFSFRNTISEPTRVYRLSGRNRKKEVHDLLNEFVDDITNPEVTPTSNHPLLIDEDVTCALTECGDPSHLSCKNIIKQLETVITNQRNEILRLNSVINGMKTKSKPTLKSSPNLLSEAQQRKLQGIKRVNWSKADITTALSIRSISPKAYNAMQMNLKIPLPANSTLRSWTRKFTCESGILWDCLKAVKEATHSMDAFSCLAVLSFDEMALDATNVLDPTYKKIISHSKVQVVMIRGLCSNWKQPVFYEFDFKMTTEMLKNIIIEVEKTGIKICSIVCDLGPENRSLLKQLDITPATTSFPNPFDSSRNVYAFADVPHCLKNIRNHLFDSGVILDDGTLLDKSVLQELISFSGSEIKLCPQLSPKSLELKGAERMKVKPAAQLLSHHSAACAWKCFPENLTIGNFFEVMNNGFDVLNSRIPKDSKQDLKSAFGINFCNQQQALSRLRLLMENSRFRTTKGNVKSALLPCQAGFLISIKSLQSMYEELQRVYNVKYILTSRLNQDCLENMFSRVRCFGGPNTNPTASEFRYRLRLILLGSQLASPLGCNVDEWESQSFYLSSKLLDSTPTNAKKIEESIQEDILQNLNKVQKIKGTFTSTELESLRYLSGFIAFKLRKRGNKNFGTVSSKTRVHAPRSSKCFPWIEMVTRGGLIIPTTVIVNTTQLLEKQFRVLYPIYEKSNYCEIKLFSHIRRIYPKLDEYTVRLFLRTRLGIRVRHLNDLRRTKLDVRQSSLLKVLLLSLTIKFLKFLNE